MVRYKYVTKIVELKFHLTWLRYCETCQIQKPLFSKPLIDPDHDISDRELIERQLRYDKNLLSADDQRKLTDLVYKYKDAFSLRGELGKNKSMLYYIKLKPDAESSHKQAYRLSDHEREIMQQEIDKLLKLGLIEPAKFTSSSCSQR